MNHLTQSEVFGRHVGKVIRTARRQLPLVPNNKHLYATIDIVFELKNDKNHKVEHVIRDNTLQSDRRVVAGDISGSIMNHVKKVLNQHDRIAGSNTHGRIYKTIKVKFYWE